MESVGIRELKRDASAILKRVRELRETVEVTYHGAPIARIVPAEYHEQGRRELAAAWEQVNRLADEVATYEAGGVSAAQRPRNMDREEAVREMRAFRERVGALVTGPVDAVEIVREQRRELGDVRG